jgi:hypothetical protein
MKLKLLLSVLLLTIGSMVHAQDTIRSLIISEALMRSWPWAYIELTNMGDEDIQLANFRVGKIEPWDNVLWTPRSRSRIFWLPERILKPGESFLIANVYDYSLEQHAKGIDTPGSGSAEVMHKKDLEEMADMQIHMKEKDGAPNDSVFPYAAAMEVGNGRDTWFLQYHMPNGDSVVVDQVGGVFDSEGWNLNQPFDANWGPMSNWGYDVGGVRGATFTAHLIRKYSVKTGNLDFANARGVGNDDSEWIAIPVEGGYWTTSFRKALWTVGNHVNAQLDENTLESDVIEVDFAGKTLTVPWGVRRNDDIMNYFVRKPGIGWNYHQAAGTSVEDSLSFAAKTGDKLELWVCGNDMGKATFEIIVKEPTADNKSIVPKLNQDPEGNWRSQLKVGMITWPRVTQNDSGIDTIWGEWGGIPYQTRIDSLIDRLDIPSNASWEFITVDGVKRPDIKNGDILRIIAQNGSEKDYYIPVNGSRPGHNGLLSAITWPDIPEYYRGIFGWQGDTIPNFNSNSFYYTITVPIDVDGIPALVAKADDLNSKVEVIRASSLSGTTEDRTVKFIVTAEDDTTINIYNVEFIKEKNPNDIQPFNAEPIISEIVHKNHWANSYAEIFNPGNQPIDLSNYMLVADFSDDPVFALESHITGSFNNRYRSYIPGYKFTNSVEEWAVNPGILTPDLNVKTLLMPGEVFAMGDVPNVRSSSPIDKLDIEFKNNPWGANQSGTNRNAVDHWGDSYMWLFKILNDSVKLGLKAANDIHDFELIDTYFIDRNWQTSWRRLPGVWKGNPVMKASQKKDDPENFEWDVKSPSDFGGSANPVPSNIGQHFFIPPTHYISTVSSVVYKVSEGYSMSESIRGMTTGTTVSGFMANIIKKDENQVLNVHSVADGSVLSMDAALSLNDTLVVMSADSVNYTKYILEVSEEGLSSNAVLTSDRYTIEIEAEPKSANDEHTAGLGTIRGFDYGTTLRTIANNVTVPGGALMNIINADGAYVPLRQLNYDTVYVSVTVSSEIFFDVLAEDRLTRIVYQLQPNFLSSDAFVTSDLYSVKQSDFLIELVPRGTNVQSFLSNLMPVFGASLKLVDKWGNVRTDGIVADDDKLLVTSADETVTNVYHIAKLASQYFPVTTYLAYILSDYYAVDQVDFFVAGATTATQVSDFYSKIRPVMGAVAAIVDANGNVKTSGDLAQGDKVKVTSGDGKIEVMYELHLTVVSAKLPQTAQVEIYPNPTTGKLNVSGLQTGNRVQIFNAMGVLMQDIKVKESIETVSLGNYANGIYFIIILDNHLITGKHKIIKF